MAVSSVTVTRGLWHSRVWHRHHPRHCGTEGSSITITPSALTLALLEPHWLEGTEVPRDSTSCPPEEQDRKEGEREGERLPSRDIPYQSQASGSCPGLRGRAPVPVGADPTMSPTFLGVAGHDQASHGSHPGDGTGVDPSRPWGHKTPRDPQDSASGTTSSSLCPIMTHGGGQATVALTHTAKK